MHMGEIVPNINLQAIEMNLWAHAAILTNEYLETL